MHVTVVVVIVVVAVVLCMRIRVVFPSPYLPFFLHPVSAFPSSTPMQQLFTTGRLKVKGNLALAMKFESVTKPLEAAARAKL